MRISESPLRNITFAVAFVLAMIGIARLSTGAAATEPPAAENRRG
jgi:hypothetical protein